MKKAKHFIDFLFWKTTWFRMLLIIQPFFIICHLYNIRKNANFVSNFYAIAMIIAYCIIMTLASIDNKPIGPDKPFMAKGILHNKTPEQIEKYFEDMNSCFRTDPHLFSALCRCLTGFELRQYKLWLKRKNQHLKTILSGLNTITELTKK